MQSFLRQRQLLFNRRSLHQSQVVWSNLRLYSSSSKPLPENVGEEERGGEAARGSSFSWMDKVLYNSYLEKFMPPPGYKQRLKERFEMKQSELEERVGKTAVMPPVSVKYLMKSQSQTEGTEEITLEKGEESQRPEDPVQFPYKIMRKTDFIEESEETTGAPQEPVKLESVAERFRRKEIDLESVLQEPHSLSDVFESASEGWVEDPGTEDPNCPPSNVPCGGCGALLHCQDQSIPGYIASEKFKQARKADLRADVCYRCSVLEAHQATLNVTVSSEDYPRIVSKIRQKYAMVLLMVDLTDFPCSIWPGLLDIIGSRRPIVLIGNKVDLLPQDSPEYLKRIEDSLIKCAVDIGMLEANIIHTALVSAKTGYGIEDLITSIFNFIKGKGDIFIMGCTNVGKSSLFNSLLQSDLCKPEASDLIQKATISQWPGTTLNLLKFPLNPPSGWKKLLRIKRLTAERPLQAAEQKERRMQLKLTHSFDHAVLTGHVGKTFISKEQQDEMESAITVNDIFHVNPRSMSPPSSSESRTPGQFDPDDPRYRQTYWVYDTPGAVNTNQILDLLTLPELMQSLPKTLIQPRSFYIKPNMSFFIGGLARLDYIDGPYPIRYTLFSNSSLPVTMSLIQDADYVYRNALGTKIFGVPTGGADRLSQFPPLKSRPVKLHGAGHSYSCADIVLSSIGWVAVTAKLDQRFHLEVYTPDGKGIFVRQPALLPYAVNYKGKRVRGTYSYLPHVVYLAPSRNNRKHKMQQQQR